MKWLILTLSIALVLSACSLPSTQTRISSNGGMYSKLSPEHRRLVAAGDIAEGMSKDAVYLAWGTPERIYKGESDGTAKERWVYTRTRPETRTSIGLGYGTYPRYSRWGYRGCVYHGFPNTVYVSEKVATIIFVGDKVESWERKK